MKYLVWSIIPIAIYLLYYFIADNNLKSLRKNQKKTQFDVCPPKAYIVVGVIDIAFVTWLMVLCASQDAPSVLVDILTDIILAFFGFLGFAIIWYSTIWRIKLDKTNRLIVFRNVFLQTYEITYDEIISYEEKTNHYIIYTTKKKIEVDLYASNLFFLLAEISKKNNPRIPKKNKQKKEKR